MKRFIEQLFEVIGLKEWIMRNWMFVLVLALALVLFLKDVLGGK